jgi:hypothetical protein
MSFHTFIVNMQIVVTNRIFKFLLQAPQIMR